MLLALTTACTNSNANEYEEEYNIAEEQEAIERGRNCPAGDRNCNGIPDSHE